MFLENIFIATKLTVTFKVTVSLNMRHLFYPF